MFLLTGLDCPFSPGYFLTTPFLLTLTSSCQGVELLSLLQGHGFCSFDLGGQFLNLWSSAFLAMTGLIDFQWLILCLAGNISFVVSGCGNSLLPAGHPLCFSGCTGNLVFWVPCSKARLSLVARCVIPASFTAYGLPSGPQCSLVHSFGCCIH